MRQALGDLWTFPADHRCVTINGIVRPNGELVMGAGNALQAKQRFGGIARRLGELVKAHGLHVYHLDDIGIFAFPTKYDWKNDSDLKLIARSAVEIVYLADTLNLENIVLPRPGCGFGNLSWKSQVEPCLTRLLDDRFIVVSQEA